MSRNLSTHDLLEGAMYAMEQAGHLVHDAVGLYERGRYSSAVVLGVYAREEMGSRTANREAAHSTAKAPCPGAAVAGRWER